MNTKTSLVAIIAILTIVAGLYKYPKATQGLQQSNDLADTMLAKLKRAYPTFANDQYANASLIMKYAVSIGVTDTAQLSYMLSTAIGESAIRPIKEIRCREGTPCWEAQNKYWVSRLISL